MNLRSLLLLREDIGESYDAVVDAAADAVGAEACHLALYDPSTRELIARRPAYTAPGEPLPQFRFPLDSSPASVLVVDSGEPHIANDPGHDPLYDPSVAERGIHSILTVPIRHEGSVLGLVYALNREGGFTAEEARTLQALSGSLAVSLENIRLYAEERDRRILHESLSAVSRTLVGSGDEDSGLAAALEQLWRVVRCNAAAAVLVEGSQLRVAAVRGGEPGSRLPLETSGDLGRRIRELSPGELALPEDVLPRLGLEGPLRRAMAAPLVSEGEAVGALVAAFESEHATEAREGELLTAFAEHTSIFLQAGRLVGREKQVLSRAAAVARVTWMVASRGDSQAICDLAVSELRALAGVERAVLYLGESGDEQLAAAADAGNEAGEREEVRRRHLPLGLPALAPVRERRVPMVLDRSPPPEIALFDDVRAVLLLPLISRDELIGAVTLLCSQEEHPFDAARVDFLQDVAQQIAFGLENARLFSALTRLASTDELTGLANRRRFLEVAEAELSRCLEEEQPFALVLADLDHLKRINDSHGHAAGDQAVAHAAHALEGETGEGELAARIGGEEFAVLMPERDVAAALERAGAACSALANGFVSGVGRVTASFGVASAPADGRAVSELLKAADGRLYRAKAAGRNRVCGPEDD